jgi:hypothetical protein
MSWSSRAIIAHKTAFVASKAKTEPAVFKWWARPSAVVTGKR